MGLLKKYIKSLKFDYGINIEKRIENIDYSSVGGLYLKPGSKCTETIKSVTVNPSTIHELIINPDFRLADVIVEGEKDGLHLFVGAVRADLLDGDTLAIDTKERMKPLLSRLTKIVPIGDVVALSIAININRLENKGDIENAIGLRKKLIIKYGERGRRIYNNYNTGVLQEIIFPLVYLLDWACTPSDMETIRRLWDACIENMDYAIFVNSQMSMEQIVKDLNKKFKIDGVKIVHIFGRTQGIIHTIDSAVKDFMDYESSHQVEIIKYQVAKKQFYSGTCDVIQITIIKE